MITLQTHDVAWPELNEGAEFGDAVDARAAAAAAGTAGAPTLLCYYASKHARSADAAGWRARIAAGQVSVDGVVVTDPGAPLPAAGCSLVYRRPPWREPPAPCALGVVWQDPAGQFLAVDKPAGLQVLPGGAFHQRCVLTLLRSGAGFRAAEAPDALPTPAPVHRLGRGTSGLLLCALTRGAARAAWQQLAAGAAGAAPGGGSAAKTYRALVSGLPAADASEVSVPIGRVPCPGVWGGLHAAAPGAGRPALSRWRVLRRDAAAGEALVEVVIATGRPHQIRIHMACAGHPLVGDPLYAAGGVPRAAAPGGSAGAGGDEGGGGGAGGAGAPRRRHAAGAPLPGDCGYALHCLSMTVRHPTTGARLRLVAPPPPRLRAPGEEGAAWRAGAHAAEHAGEPP